MEMEESLLLSAGLGDGTQEPSGRRTASFTCKPDYVTCISYCIPGESIRSPRILQLYWFGKDRFRGYNLFRSTMFSHILPRVDGKLVVPPIVHLSTSFYESNDTTEGDCLSYLDSIKGLGFEMLWLDAYWTKGGFPEGMGNYGFPIQRVEPADRFPHGLKPVGDAIHQQGMGFVVWFEPERVYRGTYIAKEHPDWVINLPQAEAVSTTLGCPKLANS